MTETYAPSISQPQPQPQQPGLRLDALCFFDTMQGIIHGDLTPKNVLLRRDPRARAG